MAVTYRPEAVTQRDGHELASSNCMSAAAASAIRYELLGGQTDSGTWSGTISSGDMRDRSGDSSGGQTSDDIERSWRAYGEDPAIRDGRPFGDVVKDLEAGRGVVLQVWHATTGKVCLSGSGAYGHGLYVNPESRQGDHGREWIVSDPWCDPPKWAWVREDRLRAGAEEWVQHSASGATGAYGRRWPDPSTIELALLKRAARELMDRYHPGHPSPFVHAPHGAGGSPGVLFVSTRPHGGTDVTINASGSDLVSSRRVDLEDDAGFYADPGFADKLGTLQEGRVLPLLGPAVGTNAYAVLVTTSTPYDDGKDRPSVVYVTKDKCSDPYDVEVPEDPNAERDAAWRAWLDEDEHAPDRSS